MTPEIIFVIAAAVFFVVGLVAVALPKREPADKFFKCARCNATARHNSRTVEAWRSDKVTFFCQACHAKWLLTRPPQERERLSSRGAAATSGCLGVVSLIAVLPFGCLLAWAYSP